MTVVARALENGLEKTARPKTRRTAFQIGLCIPWLGLEEVSAEFETELSFTSRVSVRGRESLEPCIYHGNMCLHSESSVAKTRIVTLYIYEDTCKSVIDYRFIHTYSLDVPRAIERIRR